MKEILVDSVTCTGQLEPDQDLDLPGKAEGFFVGRLVRTYGGPITDELVAARNKIRPINLRDPEALARVIMTRVSFLAQVKLNPTTKVPWGWE